MQFTVRSYHRCSETTERQRVQCPYHGMNIYDTLICLAINTWTLQGHSLGGAYATLLHCEFVRLSFSNDAAEIPPIPVKDVVTFGSPRVGVHDFAKTFVDLYKKSNSNSWRITNRWDWVTILPPRKNDFKYTHVDQEYVFSSYGPPEVKESEIGKYVSESEEELAQQGLKNPLDYFNTHRESLLYHNAPMQHLLTLTHYDSFIQPSLSIISIFKMRHFK